MKVIKINNPRWLEEIIRKEEYDDIEKRAMYFDTLKGNKSVLDIQKKFIEEETFVLSKKFNDCLFYFDAKGGKIIIQ